MNRVLALPILLVSIALAACTATPHARSPEEASLRHTEALAGDVARLAIVSSSPTEDPSAASTTEVTAAPSPPRDDASTCEAAVVYANDFGTYWYGHKPQTAHRAASVNRLDFTSVCHTMPVNVQRCMHDRYRTLHGEECDATLLRLDATRAALIDGLFLEPSHEG